MASGTPHDRRELLGGLRFFAGPLLSYSSPVDVKPFCACLPFVVGHSNYLLPAHDSLPLGKYRVLYLVFPLNFSVTVD